jgi:hypothetical protein
VIYANWHKPPTFSKSNPLLFDGLFKYEKTTYYLRYYEFGIQEESFAGRSPSDMLRSLKGIDQSEPMRPDPAFPSLTVAAPEFGGEFLIGMESA